ncbi:hypothetical protein BDV32DRAFT_141803 [Aspergillus pseudonomiae]|uniref:Uncharacterized protein n=1 Tax=Aspergillus pseudonomiae TaxID=1506151 RepID=A0A5N7CYA1_9EURO|nr:uncharacterized protein BDV37DRAFT_290465 [Aspergillus pseudonomiae]KAB8255691.1 hypothetical protein BDV32DRAFT_141803 [Aspergillus pseudonomiae]KAE8399192.1 hypothetical protein BDV37DRAFT_290465 [Aspergillus pseudonomiae]
MTRSGKYRRRQTGHHCHSVAYSLQPFLPSYGAQYPVFPRPISSVPPGSMPFPHGFIPLAHDRLPPSSFLCPQPSGTPPVWSPGPIPDFYSQHEDSGMMRNGNHAPNTFTPRQTPLPSRPTQAGYSNQHDRPVQPIPQIQPGQPFPPVQSVQPLPQFQPFHPILSGQSTRSSQHSQLLHPPPYLRPAPPIPYYPYQPVAAPAMPCVAPVSSYQAYPMLWGVGVWIVSEAVEREMFS